MFRPGIGSALGVIGLALTYNFLAFSPAGRLGGHRFDALMFFGPSLLAVGILLVLRPKTGEVAGAGYDTRLFTLGIVFLTFPLALLTLSFFAGSRGFGGTAGMLGLILLVVMGLPGLILLAWSGRIRSWFF